ncbi:hypothetical protein F903_02883 [Acinetobacter sp. NIPH 298]|nr:hypothetical protein F903_02883 [Acinetobacter sp. NIPH 298]
MVIAKILNAKRLIVKNKFDSVKTDQFTKNEQLKKEGYKNLPFLIPPNLPLSKGGVPLFDKEGLGEILLTIKGNIATRI